MKGKVQFTPEEINEVSALIEQKLAAPRDEQKRIRDKIMAIGFYATDFGIGGGYTVEDFLQVINKAPNVDDIQTDLIRRYKAKLKSDQLKDEVYKWNLLAEFKGRPNVGTDNFAEEVKSVKFLNLLYPMAIAVSNHLAKDRPEPYRECLIRLFDESVPLQKRITDFTAFIQEIYKDVGTLSHHHDERTVATLLTYHNPEKYAFYKDSFYQKYCKLLGIQSHNKGEKYVHYLELLKQFISTHISTNKELLEMVQELLPAEAYKDPTHTVLAQDILYTVLDKGQEQIDIENAKVFKVSMGSLSIEEMDACMNQSIVVVHGDTKSKGTSSETQSEVFQNAIRMGDYFYLTHGNGPNSIKFLGRFTTACSVSSTQYDNNTGWLERGYEVVATSVNQMRYKGPNKWWTPNNNSTCIQIRNDELPDANKLLFEPYFNTTLVASEDVAASDVKQSNEMPNPPLALNQIFYGPPGTGKTFKLIKEYYPLFTSRSQEASEDQIRIDLVTNYTWWQVVSAAVLDLKSSRVTEILNHPIVQIKDSISNQKNARAMVWAMLQTHTMLKCKNVNYTSRREPLFFNKDDDGTWSIDNEIVYNEAPEVLELLEAWGNPETAKAEVIKRYEFVTFHQSFSYEDFVEGIKPVMEEDAQGKDIQYRIEPGIFKRLCNKARRDPENKYALFIDEINRGNVSQIFGELITLIEDDKREGRLNVELELPYSKEKFSVPSNLYLIGTMNTADRSVEALDTALRRRFSFIEMAPLYHLPELKVEVAGVTPADLLLKINERLEKLLDKDHLIGHSYFIGVNGDLGKLRESFQHKIIPLLQEYFYGDIARIGLVLGKGFFEDIQEKDESIFADFEYDASGLNDRKVYHFINVMDKEKMTDKKFKEAISSLMK